MSKLAITMRKTGRIHITMDAVDFATVYGALIHSSNTLELLHRRKLDASQIHVLKTFQAFVNQVQAEVKQAK